MSKRNLTTSILGDSGATEATVVPNLETLNTGNDNYLTSISDTSEFNVYQQLKIYDNFWDTQFAEHIVNSVNSGSIVTNAVIQGNTEGWVRADHMAVSVPFEITYNVRTIDNRAPNSTPSASTDFNGGRASLTRYLNDIRLLSAYHPRYAFIDCFNRFKILLGNNGQQIQKTAETQPLGLKHHMAHHRYGKEVGMVQACWGMRNSHTRILTTNYSTTVVAEYQNVFGKQINGNDVLNPLEAQSDILKTWNEDDESISYIRFLQYGVSPLYNNISAQRLQETVTPLKANINVEDKGPYNTVNVRNCFVVKVVRTLTLPLQSIIPFFRGAKYLPPDFRFKFELESNASKYICQSSRAYEDNGSRTAHYLQQVCRHTGTNETNYRTLGFPSIVSEAWMDPRGWFPVGTVPLVASQPGTGIDSVTTPFNMQIYPAAYNKDFYITAQMRLGDVKFQYPWHILRQPVQAAISTMWLQKPFLYNYETTELLENVFIDGQQTVNIQVAISAQRPTVIVAYLVPTADQFWGYAACNQTEIYGGTYQANELYRANFLAHNSTAGPTAMINTVVNTTNSTRLNGNAAITLYGGFGSVDPYMHPVMIADSPTRWGQNTTPISPPVQWSDLEIRFSGRTGYRFRNDYTGANLFGEVNCGAQNWMCSLWNEQSYRTYGTEVNNEIKTDRDSYYNGLANNWNAANGNELINLVIQPGGWTDRGIISSRQGATTIQLVITFKVPLSSKTKLCVFRTNPEQLVFDSDKNVTIIQWPAVKNNSGYLLPNVTAAP